MGGLAGLLTVYVLTLLVEAAADIQVVLDAGNIIFGIMISITIGVISGIVPAWFAASMDPVEAIRSN